MFDWLKKLLFEEEEVTIEESEIEEIDFTNNNRKDIADIIANREVKSEAEEIEPISFVEKEEPTKNFGIEVEPIVEEKIKPARPIMTQPVKNNENKVVEMNVISPMYGGSGESKPNKKTVTIDTAPKRRSDALGTIISPMYGQSELATHEKEAKMRIEEEKKPVIVKDDWDNEEVKLEDILFNEEESEDCVQFSLFGEDVSQVKIEEDDDVEA